MNPDLRHVPFEAIADRFGTPTFVYDAATIRDRGDRMVRAITYPKVSYFYSLKANPAVAVVELLKNEGFGADVCSPGDLSVASAAGIDRSRISYTGFGSSDAELAGAVEGSATVVVDSIEEISRIARVTEVSAIGLRVNPGIWAGFHGHVISAVPEAKFGIAPDELELALAEADAAGLRIEGLHSHLGSDVRESSAHIALLKLLTGIAVGIPTVEWINLGGGYGTPRRGFEAQFDWGALDRAAHSCLRLPGGRELELRLEPGGYPTMESGYLLTRVVSTKKGWGPRPDIVSLDGNTNHVISALLYKAHHEVRPVVVRPGEVTNCRVAGNLMQAADLIAESAPLPPVEIGDLVTINQVGAYAASRTSTFNGRSRPAEVLVDGSEITLIRAAELIGDEG